MDLNKITEELIKKNNSEENEAKKFMDEKIYGFCKFIESKDIPGLNRNINSLKLIYQIGAISVFIRNFVIPRKEKIQNPTVENQREILWLISPEEDIDKILTIFTEEEKNKVINFMNFLIDVADII